MPKLAKNDVAYFKPLCCCKKGTALVGHKNMFDTFYDIHTKTKPIAYSTKATKDWLHILQEESNSWEEMLNKANGSTKEYLKDEEAVKVIEAYMKIECPFEEMRF